MARMGRGQETAEFWQRNLQGRDHFEDLDTDKVDNVRIIASWIPDRDKWLDVVNTLMNLWVS